MTPRLIYVLVAMEKHALGHSITRVATAPHTDAEREKLQRRADAMPGSAWVQTETEWEQ